MLLRNRRVGSRAGGIQITNTHLLYRKIAVVSRNSHGEYISANIFNKNGSEYIQGNHSLLGTMEKR